MLALWGSGIRTVDNGLSEQVTRQKSETRNVSSHFRGSFCYLIISLEFKIIIQMLVTSRRSSPHLITKRYEKKLTCTGVNKVQIEEIFLKIYKERWVYWRRGGMDSERLIEVSCHHDPSLAWVNHKGHSSQNDCQAPILTFSTFNNLL